LRGERFHHARHEQEQSEFRHADTLRALKSRRNDDSASGIGDAANGRLARPGRRSGRPACVGV